MRLAYPVDIQPDGKFLMATCPDIPAMGTQGDSLKEALEMAEDALVTAISFYFDQNEKVPMPSKAKAGQHLVALPERVTAKVLRWNMTKK